MEQKLSNEEIARAIGMYIHSGVYYRDYTYCKTQQDIEKENKHDLNYLRVLTPVTLTTTYVGSIATRDVSKIKPILTPLSAITDEHAVEVAKMVSKATNIDWLNSPIDDIKTLITAICGFNKVGYQYDDEYLYVLHSGVVISIIDQLREWRYMLPYMGIDLFEAGIAIDNSKNVEK